MLNQVTLIGRTTGDIELKESENGKKFGIVTVATTRPFKDAGTDEYGTDFIDVSLWGKTAENAVQHVGKGSAVSIRGRVANRVIDIPSEQTFKTIGIIGDRVSFIQLKPPLTNNTNEASL